MKKIEKKVAVEQIHEWLKAVHNNDIKIIQRMLNDGLNINYQGKNGWTALHHACLFSHLEIVRFLVDNGADINIKDQSNETPLDKLKRHYQQKYKRMTEWLAENHPEKMLEYMASESVQGKGLGL